MKGKWLGWRRDICDTCKKRRLVGVHSSSLGAMSIASCRLCLAFYAEPLWLVKFTIEECNGNCADWFWNLYTFKDGFYIQAKELPR